MDKKTCVLSEYGRCVVEPRDSEPFLINAAQLHYLVKWEHIALSSLTEEDIWDRIKVDRFVKIFACIQIGRLVLQCLGRAAQHMPITPLGTATFCFAIPSLATFLLWFNRPMDIEIPIYLDVPASTAELLVKVSPQPYSWRQTPLDFIAIVNSLSFTSEIISKSSKWPNREAFLGPSTRIRNAWTPL